MNKKIKLIVIILVIALSEKSLAQTKYSKSTEFGKRREKVIKSLKQIAFCKCLQNGYYYDSALQKDPSGFIISDIVLGNFGSLQLVDSLTKSYISQIPKYQPGRQSESLEIKPIILYCLRFYESRKLDSTIRKFVKEFYSK